jgi:hypothetical protein
MMAQAAKGLLRFALRYCADPFPKWLRRRSRFFELRGSRFKKASASPFSLFDCSVLLFRNKAT